MHYWSLYTVHLFLYGKFDRCKKFCAKQLISRIVVFLHIDYKLDNPVCAKDVAHHLTFSHRKVLDFAQIRVIYISRRSAQNQRNFHPAGGL